MTKTLIEGRVYYIFTGQDIIELLPAMVLAAIVFVGVILFFEDRELLFYNYIERPFRFLWRIIKKIYLFCKGA